MKRRTDSAYHLILSERAGGHSWTPGCLSTWRHCSSPTWAHTECCQPASYPCSPLCSRRTGSHNWDKRDRRVTGVSDAMRTACEPYKDSWWLCYTSYLVPLNRLSPYAWGRRKMWSNMVARTKSCYGQFGVWSTVSHPSVQMSLGGKEWERERERRGGGRESAAVSPWASGRRELTGTSNAMKLGWKLRPLQLAIWFGEDARQSPQPWRKWR